MKIICFDVNGTLVEESPWDTFSLKGEAKENFKKVFNDFYDNKVGVDFLWEEVVSILKKDGKGNKEYILNSSKPMEHLKEGAEDLIKYLKEKGYKIYLISCSVDIYLEKLCKGLLIDGFYAGTNFSFDGEELTTIESDCTENDFKEKRLKELANKEKIDIEDIFFVGDGFNDIGAFKLTGKGIAIDSNVKELNNIAYQKIKKLKEIKNIL
ncbi:MAG: HAD-IB family phosphatase [Candidatus Paceibacterota bacterium]|jgi:phosphoserine phosphatase